MIAAAGAPSAANPLSASGSGRALAPVSATRRFIRANRSASSTLPLPATNAPNSTPCARSRPISLAFKSGETCSRDAPAFAFSAAGPRCADAGGVETTANPSSARVQAMTLSAGFRIGLAEVADQHVLTSNRVIHDFLLTRIK